MTHSSTRDKFGQLLLRGTMSSEGSNFLIFQEELKCGFHVKHPDS